MLKGGGAITTSKDASNSSIVQLSPIVATNTALNASTEKSNSYTSNVVHIGRGTLSLKEISQSVVVVTRQRLDDQNLQTLSEAMRQTIGATIYPYAEGVRFYLRGYEIDRYQLDGLSIDAGSFNFDTAAFDHIEVLKGPAGLLQGSGEPGGTINMVRKRALKNLNVSANFFGGSYDTYRGEIDISVPLAQEGRFRGRIVAVQDNRKSFIDEVFNNKSVFYGTLEYDFDPYTTLSIGTTYQGGKSIINAGLPSIKNGGLYNISRSAFLGDEWNKNTQNTTKYFVDLQHRLKNGGEIRIAFNAFNQEAHTKTSTWGASYPDALGNMNVLPYKFHNKDEDRAIDAYITTPFNLLGQHNILIGFSRHTTKSESVSTKGNSLITKNLFHPTHDSPEPDWSTKPFKYIANTEENALYSRLRLKFFNVTLIGGARLSWLEDKTNDIKINAKVTPYAGLIYDINATYSIYASFAQTFKPQTNVTFEKKVIGPRRGDQYEIGAKATWLGDRLNAQVAFFWINDENRAMEDSEHPDFSVAMGKARVIGSDIELTGQILPVWDISLGYAYVQSKYVVADPEYKGRLLAANTPEHSFKLWNRHNISHWRIGYGVVFSSPIYVNIRGPERKVQGSYATVSALIGYTLNDKVEFNLNADNIFDHKYYSKAEGWTRQTYYGEPRSFMLSVRARY